MYERMLIMKDQEINRLYELLKIQKSNAYTSKIKEPTKFTENLLDVVFHNIGLLDEDTIKKHLSVSSPAYKSIVALLQKLFISDNVLCNISYQNYITYLKNGKLETIYYIELFDKIFKKVYEKSVIACKELHENIKTEHDNNISDYCHENIMMLFSDNDKKAKIQKSLLKVIKPMFVHKT
jgi:hypothetical protein